MATFTKQELLHIATLSALKLEESEVAVFTEQINTILTYVDQLAPVVIKPVDQDIRNVNVFRDDVAVKKDRDAVQAIAPEVDEGYFVVPTILEEK